MCVCVFFNRHPIPLWVNYNLVLFSSDRPNPDMCFSSLFFLLPNWSGLRECMLHTVSLLCTCACATVHLCVSVCMSVCVSVCMSVCVSVCMSVCVSVCVFQFHVPSGSQIFEGKASARTTT